MTYIFAGIFMLISMVLFYREYSAEKKRKSIDRIREQIYMPLKQTTLTEAAAMAAVGTGLSLFDIYTTLSRHSDVLDVLEQRFPNAHGADDLWDWFANISTLLAENSDSLETYVSCFKGQAAENIAVQLLRSQGLDAELFDSVTNETNDIFVRLGDNSFKYYSVKCGSPAYITQCINESDATSYVINSESYDALEASGMLDVYESQGIEIIDGDFSNVELTDMAETAFHEIGTAGDVSDNIPYVALAFLGFKTYRNIKEFSEGKQSKHEVITNVEMDVLKFGSMGVFTSVGSEIGGYLGTLICPGVGTVIGAGIGIFAGALFGGSIFEWGKEKLKWGKIIAAQDYFGEKFESQFDYGFGSNIVDKYLNTRQIKMALAEETKLCEQYADELDPYNRKNVTVCAVLAQECCETLKTTNERILYTKYALGNKAIQICNSSVQALSENQRGKFSRRLLGELIIANSDCLNTITPGEKDLLDGYRTQKAIASNYPYQFSTNPKTVMENLVKQIFNAYWPQKKNKDKKSFFNKMSAIIFLILGVVLVIWQFVCN